MRLFVSALALAAAWIAAPLAAEADPGFVASRTFARAGPDESFPRVAFLRRGTRIEVRGCLDRYDWCDVQWGRHGYERGWVDGDVIDFYYRGRPWRSYDYFRYRRPAIVFFDLDTYWGDNYRDQRFFYQRDQFRRFDRRGGRGDEGDRNRNRTDQNDRSRFDQGRGDQGGYGHPSGAGGPPPSNDQQDQGRGHDRGRDRSHDQGQGGPPPNPDQSNGQQQPNDRGNGHDQGQGQGPDKGHDQGRNHGRGHDNQSGDQNCHVDQNNQRVCDHP